MLVKELSNANRIDCNASIIISSTTTTTMKRKRDDSCISTSYHQDDDDDDDLLPLHKRYAASSSSNRLSAFGMSSYDTESRDGPATSSSTNGNDRLDDSNDDSEEDDETAALVSNFRTSILRGNPQTASRLEPPHTISPSTTTSLACSPYSLYNDCYDGDDADYNDAKGTTSTSSNTYPDFPSIGRATTISDSSDVSSVESDPIDMSSRPTSPQEEILQEEQHEDYDCSSDYSPWSSSTELSTLEYTTNHRVEEVVEKDAIEEARERSSSIDRSSSPSSSMAPARRQPSPLWIMSSSSTPSIAQVRGEEETSFWPATANWNGMFPQGSSQVS